MLYVKHMVLRLLFVKDMVERDLVEIKHIRSEDNAADVLTKAVSPVIFARCLMLLKGVRRIT